MIIVTKVEKIIEMRYGEIKAYIKVTHLYKVLSLVNKPCFAANYRMLK